MKFNMHNRTHMDVQRFYGLTVVRLFVCF